MMWGRRSRITAGQIMNILTGKEGSMAATLHDIVQSSEAKRLATGFVFTEGPLWHPDGYLLFVDIRRSEIFKLVPGGEPELIREHSGESNGMTFDTHGRVVICEMVNRRVTRMEADGSFTVLADQWDHKRLNRPNDVVGKSDGSLYFTNPGESVSILQRWTWRSIVCTASDPTAQWIS